MKNVLERFYGGISPPSVQRTCSKFSGIRMTNCESGCRMTKFERLQSMSLDEFADICLAAMAEAKPTIRLALRSEYIKDQLRDQIIKFMNEESEDDEWLKYLM